MPLSIAERIAILRQRCLARKQSAWLDYAPEKAASLQASEGAASWQVRKGMLTRDVLSQARLALDDLEILAGRPAPRPADLTDARLSAAHAVLQRYPWPGGQGGHCELDFEPAFRLGLGGLMADIDYRARKTRGDRAEVYRSFLLALEGLSNLCQRAAACADACQATAPAWRRAELAEIAASCCRVAVEPPATFRDALQLMFLTYLGLWIAEGVRLVVPGHIDRTLMPFYERDLAAGRLDEEKALWLLESLYLLINEMVPDSLAVSVMVGGRDSAGRDMTNRLSYLCLEALRRTRLAYPTVGVCWHEATPRPLIDLAAELIADGLSTPAFFGDETIQKGLRYYGVPPNEACCYINSTCVEITPSGASNVWVASPYFNTCGILLAEIAAAVEDPPHTFEKFLQRYQRRLATAIADAVAEQNRLRRARQAHGGRPLQSVFTRSCLERGRDLDDGGATYNWVECSFVGLANLADALHVIRSEIFSERRLTLPNLKTILDADYAGAEEVRQRFLHGHPKYGQGVEAVDRLVADMVSFVAAECPKHRMHPDNSPFIPGAFVWIMHERLGKETGATPDGRKAGKPFADGCGPAQGREKFGPTASILSTTSWDHSPMIGGLAYNMRFNTSLFRASAGFRPLADLVLTFLRRGGFETQINVVDVETLEAAQRDPEAYRDLVVRIGGYTDYFVRLSPEMQEEVMARTAFGSG